MIIEIRLYTDYNCKKEATFVEYKRLKVDLLIEPKQK